MGGPRISAPYQFVEWAVSLTTKNCGNITRQEHEPSAAQRHFFCAALNAQLAINDHESGVLLVAHVTWLREPAGCDD